MSAGREMDERINGPAKHLYEFGVFRIDVNKRLLLKGDETVPLTPKAFDTLLLLVENSGRLVSKDDLMSRLWPDTVVEEGSLSRNIYLLRKALGEGPQEHRYIVTVPGQGYRFVAHVREFSEESPSLRVTERTRTRVVVSETDTQEQDEELSELPFVRDTARTQMTGSALESRALEIGRTRSHFAISNRRTAIIIALAIALAAISIVIWLYKFGGSSRPDAGRAQSSQRMTITNITTTNDIVCAAISPDGNYVAYARADNLQLNSLWIMQLVTFNSQLVIPPAEVQYHALTFSPDGNYIYYVVRENNDARRALYRVSTLGGPAKKLIDKVETRVAFSPDGAQIAFRRGMHDRRESALLIANADGTQEREIAAVKYPEGLGDPSWSPDGKLIVCAAGHTSGGSNKYMLEVSVGDGAIKTITSQRWRWIGQLSWLSDSSGLLMVASEDPAAPYQIWHLSYPSGEARKLTNDSNFYNSLNLSADSNALLALQQRQDSKVRIIPADDASRAKEITFGSGGYRTRLSWTPDGKIVYDSSVGNSTAISIMDADGSNPKNLMGDMTGRAIVGYSTVSPDGRYILYTSDLTGTKHIWRMGIDGSNPIQLTGGGGEDDPSYSPDGKWVFYTNIASDNYSVWKVPIDGGKPIQLTDAFATSPAVSPDGKLMACFLVTGSNRRIAIYPAEGGQPIKVFPTIMQGSPSLRWTPDGRGVTYGENPIGTSKIWIQPLDGSPPRKLIELETDRVLDFDWSRDGKYLACISGIWANNIVLIKSFR